MYLYLSIGTVHELLDVPSESMDTIELNIRIKLAEESSVQGVLDNYNLHLR